MSSAIAIDFPLPQATVQRTFAAGGRVHSDGPGTVVCTLIHRTVIIDSKTDSIAAAGYPNPWGVVFTVAEDLDPCELVAEFVPQGANQSESTHTVSPITIED